MIRNLLIWSVAAALPAVAQAQYIGGHAPPPPAAPLPGMAESPSAALARNVRLLAINPRNYEALVGAGKAALATGDAEAAVGFYGRAEEVNPRSWIPRIGQGAALVQMSDPQSALRAFAEAERLGASTASFAVERGLAYDLIGDQVRAQADYRIALNGVDANEARRRLALSLAISGKRMEALTTLDPLLARRDPGAQRARAFVLALTGDLAGARTAVATAMPGSAPIMDPFIRRLATLTPAAKAAAVNLGVMPDNGSSNTSSYASNNSTYTGSTPGPGAGGSRLAEIDRMFTPSPRTPAPAPVQPIFRAPAALPPAVQMASALPRAAAAEAPAKSRYWVQLASGSDPAKLPDQFRRLASRHKDVFEGISGYMAQEGSRVRLLVGPFRSSADARTFADDLVSVDVDAFQWTSAPGQSVRKLPPQ
jgi:Flp pilus assembly protein TadD